MDAIPEPEILAHWVRHDLACFLHDESWRCPQIAYCDRWEAALLSIAHIPLGLDDLEERQGPNGDLPIHEGTHSYAPCLSIYYFFSCVSSDLMSDGRRALLHLDENILKGFGDLLNENCLECRAIFDDWLAGSRLQVDALRNDGFYGSSAVLDDAQDSDSVAAGPMSGACPVAGPCPYFSMHLDH
ncbi:hypothetical protein K523DRAFT_89610 [Schizophyllum commune Tattone D]|nr:hypothetical protein K523DRAFT_89610 [Schizophyllum commune Tattone D]